MIEFKGFYFRPDNIKALSVLVQFDGTFLHVWHLSDPFYRLISSDDFYVVSNRSDGKGIIKVSNGIRIESDDQRMLSQLKTKSQKLRRKHTRRALVFPTLIFLTSMIFLIVGIWLAVHSS
jgi:hypothetical protein